MFRPRAALLTLYGDYIRYSGIEIGIGCLIELLSNFDLSEQSVRSAVSRMCQVGLLRSRRENRKSYYSLTENGYKLLNRGTQRIFTRKNHQWDGKWNIVIYSVPEKRREARDRLRTELSWMGYGPLGEAIWISPYDMTREVDELAGRLNIKDCIQIFQAEHVGATDPKTIVSRCWDLDRIHGRYANFIDKYKPKLENYLVRVRYGEGYPPSECFVERFNLIHEYRKLPFLDPDLPKVLLPESWLRPEAAALFDHYHDSLSEKASEYFNLVSRKYKGEE